MTAHLKTILSEADYLTFERSSSIKHEFYRGRIYAMAGAKEAHNIITSNTLATLHTQLRRTPCIVYPSDMRVKVLRTGLNTYPDITVVCGQAKFTDQVRDTLVNPMVIIEVLSASTERYDRGLKFQNYRTIDTLQDYILISQTSHRVEHYTRQDQGLWLLQEFTSLDETILIRSINCTLLLEDIYEKVVLESDDEDLPREIPAE
jgi:Uma2 family endonuclease